MDDVQKVYDGYDTGVRFADHHVGRIVEMVESMGLGEETALMVSADHGENLGELGIDCDHQTADEFTTHLPMILRWPGLTPSKGSVRSGFHYQIDVMATVLELFGAEVPERWDGMSFAPQLVSGAPSGRDHLVLSHAAWTAQRSVRFERWICIRTYHDAYHGFPEVMLFDLDADPYEQWNVADDNPAVVERALDLLRVWGAAAMERSAHGIDPLWALLKDGGPWHSRVDVDWYLQRLRTTGRQQWADYFAAGPPSVTGVDEQSFLNPSTPSDYSR